MSASVHAGMPPPGADTPKNRPPRSRHPPWSRHRPWEQTPRADTPLEQTPPQSRPPPREADSSIRYTSGRYASYWNAFLFEYVSPSVQILSFSCSYQQQFCIHAPPPYIIHTQPFGSWHPLLGNLWLRSLYSS